MKRTPWFRFRKNWSENLNREKFKEATKGVSFLDAWLIMNGLSVLVAFPFFHGHADAPDEKAGEARAAVVQKDIDTFAADRNAWHAIAKERDRAFFVYGANSKQVKEVSSRFEAAAVKDAAWQTTITGKILLDPALGEENAYDLVEYYAKNAGAALPPDLEKVRKKMSFMDECRGIAKSPEDVSKLSICMLERYKVQDKKHNSIENGVMLFGLASFAGFAGISAIGSRMRRRVEEDEKKIVKTELKEAIEGLEDVLKPKKLSPRNPS